jgi:hypothetical protein
VLSIEASRRPGQRANRSCRGFVGGPPLHCEGGNEEEVVAAAAAALIVADVAANASVGANGGVDRALGGVSLLE